MDVALNRDGKSVKSLIESTLSKQQRSKVIRGDAFPKGPRDSFGGCLSKGILSQRDPFGADWHGKSVSMDMWEPYMKVAKALIPKADVVHDKFHLIKYLNKAIDDTRKTEVKREDLLKKSKYVLLKNTSKHTDQSEGPKDSPKESRGPSEDALGTGLTF